MFIHAPTHAESLPEFQFLGARIATNRGVHSTLRGAGYGEAECCWKRRLTDGDFKERIVESGRDSAFFDGKN